MECETLTPGAIFVKQPAVSDEKVLKDFLREYLSEGYISETDDIAASFPIFAVPKKNGSFRVVHDLRELNKHFVPPKLYYPSVYAAIAKGHTVYAKVDIKDCFLQFKLNPDFSKYFGFQIFG